MVHGTLNSSSRRMTLASQTFVAYENYFCEVDLYIHTKSLNLSEPAYSYQAGTFITCQSAASQSTPLPFIKLWPRYCIGKKRENVILCTAILFIWSLW